MCGNGVLQINEECDDGNLLTDDGCDSVCVIEFCGDGIAQASEECDDANLEDEDECSNECTWNGTCGDGI